MKIALAGNPNCGKTTLYNVLTGKNEKVGNWSGVTVDKKVALLKRKYREGEETEIVDLPGAYSISPFTGEEKITRDFVLKESPDVIINVIDGANISRSLFFTTQLIELGIPVIAALNKSDIIKRRGSEVDVEQLEAMLGTKVMIISASMEEGISDLIAESKQLGIAGNLPEFGQTFDTDLDRQKYVDQIIEKSIVSVVDASKITLSDRVDMIVAHKWFGLPIFFLVMWGVFAVSINGIGGYFSGYLNETLFGKIIPNGLNGFFEGIGVHPLMQALIVDGAIGGIGAVIGFLPLIMVLFFCLSLLEDCGYMARVAVVMDRFFKKIGLSGKSIIPMIVGTGCAIPGVMATRTIEDVNERRMTTILTPFVPCGAKLPIIALFSAAFFPGSSWVGPSVYMLAIAVIIFSGLLLKKLFVWESNTEFIMELPEYKVPSVKRAFFQMLDKGKGFIYKAATIILVCNTLVWFAQAYSWNLQPVVDQSNSILATLGTGIAPILIPLGIFGWQLAAATITGFIAKENVVATIAVLLAVASEDALVMSGGPLEAFFTPVTAYAFLAFNLFTPPCFAAIGAMNSEMGSKKWLFRAVGFQLGVGYTVAMLISQIGTLVIYKEFAAGFMPAIGVMSALIVIVIYNIRKSGKTNEKLNVRSVVS